MHQRLLFVLRLTIIACAIPIWPASARQDCRYVDFGGRDVSYCQEVCRTTPLKDWLARWTPRPDNPPGWGSRPPHRDPQSSNAAPRPYIITSCKATPSPDIPGACRITACGTILAPQDTLRSTHKTNAVDKRVLTPKPHAGPPLPGPLGPGLVEGDGGFARQGPAGTGTPSAPTSGGRSLGGSTYSH
jgi:hypothetical protein